MENIVFDRNYELVSEDNSFADAVYKQITAPDGFFASFTKKMDAIPKIIVPEDQANYEYLLERCDQSRRIITDGSRCCGLSALSFRDQPVSQDD